MIRWIVVGTDARMAALHEKLRTKFEAIYFISNTWTEQLNDAMKSFQPTHIMLPINPITIDVDYFPLHNVKEIWMGKDIPQLIQETTERDIRVKKYLQDEQWIWQNARLTSESFLRYFYETTKESIEGQSFKIFGFGRVAKCLAYTLTSLRANVMIYARSDYQVAEAEAMGYEATNNLSTILFPNTLVVNTIPVVWVSDVQWNMMKNAKEIFDLASAPGCLNNIHAENYKLLSAIPGKMLPVSAGNLLWNQIEKFYG